MPTFILASYLPTHLRNENGEKYAVSMEENGIAKYIKSFVRVRHLMVIVANNPILYEDNDEKLNITKQSFGLSNMSFEETILLDNRNKDRAKELISNADLVILSGGKIICENNFLKEIRFKDLIKDSNALVVGVSAGAMNLCNKIFNFPEELCDIPDPRIVDGMGFFDGYLIPHFDGRECKYQLDCEEIDAIDDYILPFSEKHEILGLHNNSYIIVHNGKPKFFGEYCKINNRQVQLFNCN